MERKRPVSATPGEPQEPSARARLARFLNNGDPLRVLCVQATIARREAELSPPHIPGRWVPEALQEQEKRKAMERATRALEAPLTQEAKRAYRAAKGAMSRDAVVVTYLREATEATGQPQDSQAVRQEVVTRLQADLAALQQEWENA
jgi:hypothetical protein